MQVGGASVLALTVNKTTVFYALAVLDHGFGEAAFRLTKAIGAPGEAAAYDVLIDGARSSCECPGFLRARSSCERWPGPTAFTPSVVIVMAATAARARLAPAGSRWKSFPTTSC